MSRKGKIDPSFYETHDFAEDIAEAKRNGTLIVSKPGESALEAIDRAMLAGRKSGGSGTSRPAPPLAAKAG
jgi:hypothetical protein